MEYTAYRYQPSIMETLVGIMLRGELDCYALLEARIESTLIYL